MNLIEEAFSIGLKPPDRSPPWKWAERWVEMDKSSPFPGIFDSGNSPFIREPMESFADPEVNDLTICCSAQSAKTVLCQILALWCIAEDPGPLGWWMASIEDARDFGRTRFMPMVEGCPPVKALLPSGLHDKTMRKINFDTMYLFIKGAGSDSAMRSVPLRVAFFDEARDYEPGRLEAGLKRTNAHSWNATNVVLSTPDMVGDSFDQRWKESDMREYHVQCPGCGEHVPLKWSVKDDAGNIIGGMIWEESEKTRPGGEWSIPILAETIRYKFQCCGHEMEDNRQERKKMNDSGVWVATNPNAPKNHRGYHWNAMLPIWTPWEKLVKEFLQAQEATKYGSIEPLHTFINERLGEAFEDVGGDPLRVTIDSEYEKGQLWDEAHMTFLTVDVQDNSGHFWFLVCSWAQDGRCRVIDEGMLLSYEEIEQAREKYGIPCNRVAPDTAHDTRTVYANCVRYGWTGLRGADRKSFTHSTPRGRVERMYSAPKHGDPGAGTSSQGKRFATYIEWANPTIKDMTDRILKGKGAKVEYPKNISQDFLNQIQGEKKRPRHDRQGRQIWEWVRSGKHGAHLLDCFRMQVVLAVASKLLLPEED